MAWNLRKIHAKGDWPRMLPGHASQLAYARRGGRRVGVPGAGAGPGLCAPAAHDVQVLTRRARDRDDITWTPTGADRAVGRGARRRGRDREPRRRGPRRPALDAGSQDGAGRESRAGDLVAGGGGAGAAATAARVRERLWRGHLRPDRRRVPDRGVPRRPGLRRHDGHGLGAGGGTGGRPVPAGAAAHVDGGGSRAAAHSAGCCCRSSSASAAASARAGSGCRGSTSTTGWRSPPG